MFLASILVAAAASLPPGEIRLTVTSQDGIRLAGAIVTVLLPAEVTLSPSLETLKPEGV